MKVVVFKSPENIFTIVDSNDKIKQIAHLGWGDILVEEVELNTSCDYAIPEILERFL